MTPMIVCYDKCSTCRKARKWLDAHEIDYAVRAIDKDNPTAEELRAWVTMSGLDVQKFFNTSGKLYREMNLKDKLKTMSDDEKIELLSVDGMLVKRPVLVLEDKVLVGFKEDAYAKELI